MPYLWENYSVDNHYSLAVNNFCPYTEIFQMSGRNAKVNILHRFGGIFEKISAFVIDVLHEETGLLSDYMDALFHILANIDFYLGITEKEIEILRMVKDIQAGAYGIDRSVFDQLLFEHKYSLLSYVYLKQCSDNRTCYFFDFLVEIFRARLYYSELKDTYIVQIATNQDELFGLGGTYCAGQLVSLAQELLCDFWLNVEIYWGAPIAVIGEPIVVDETQMI